MGGQYPSGGEFNFAGVDTGSAHHVVDGWLSDVPITFAGLELGRDMPSAARLGTDAARRDSPVRAAYEWHVGRCSTLHESWDPIAVLYGIIGLGPAPTWVPGDCSVTEMMVVGICGRKWFKFVSLLTRSLQSTMDKARPRRDQCQRF